MDPRTEIIKEYSRQLAFREEQGSNAPGDPTRPRPDLFEISSRIEEVMKREKNMFPNLDFYCASAYTQCGEGVN